MAFNLNNYKVPEEYDTEDLKAPEFPVIQEKVATGLMFLMY